VLSSATLTVPSFVSLEGHMVGPFSYIYYATMAAYPVLLVKQSATTAIQLGPSDSHVRNLAMYWPNQVAPTATTPTVYPAAITSTGIGSGGGGQTVEGVTLINAYDGIVGCFARGSITNCLIGAFHSGIVMDFSQDFTTIDIVYHQVMWDIFAGLSYPQAIDTWVSNNGGGLTMFRVDGFNVSNWGVFGNGTGITLGDSPNTTQNPRNSYGKFTNLEIDTVSYGVAASSTNLSGGGVLFNNTNIASTIQDMALVTGGLVAPWVMWIGGNSRGTGTKYGVGAGLLNCQNVNGITGPFLEVPNLTSPTMPASTVYLVNPFPFAVTVYITGGTVSAVAINQKTLAITSGLFHLRVTDEIAITYSAAPTWTWWPA
jgi:hypothetical protein